MDKTRASPMSWAHYNTPPSRCLPSPPRPSSVQRMPPALFLLPAITSLTLHDVGLGRLPPPPNQPANLQGLYPLPRELRQLAPTLRELSLLQHCCAPEELAVLSEVTPALNCLQTRADSFPFRAPTCHSASFPVNFKATHSIALPPCSLPFTLPFLQMSGLTSLSLASRPRPAPVPDALSTLTGLRQLKISHGLSQVGYKPGVTAGEHKCN